MVVPVGADCEPGPGAVYVLDRLGSWVGEHLEGVGFSGKPGEVAVIPTGGGLPYQWVVMVGVGDDPDHETVRRASGAGFRAAPRTDRLVTTLHQLSTPGALAATAEGALLAAYRYENYRSKPSDRPVPEVGLVSPVPSDWRGTVERSRVVAEAVVLVRDWVNQPPQDQGPADLAALMSAAAVEAGMTVEIWDEEKLLEEGMGGILSVGRGSHRPPRLVRLIGPGDGPRLTLVGKGITFDSGGLSLKPAKNQELMKCDMAGAAAVAGAGVAISRLGLDVRVEVLAALAENMPGGGASRPGDVFTARNGKTVEVVNTDAEGRLVLADALALGAEGSPDLMVDLATLTGSTAVAVGLEYAGTVRIRGCQESSCEGGRGGRGEGLAAPPPTGIPQNARLARGRYEEHRGSVGWRERRRLVAEGVHCRCPLGASGHTRARQDQKGRTLFVGRRHRVRCANLGAACLTDGE